ncbi:MAG: cell wall-binding repeat-containing protein [Actinomycetia bacterium]|nr:cell wall-binding repeat-containing protein [Actinomycetes bacterium]
MRRSTRPPLWAAVTALVTVSFVLLASPAYATISRTLAMQRAQRWVDLTIPYSQTLYRTADGAAASASTGWRTDCSGFVSMCWNTSKPGYSTRTLNTIAQPITKEALQPGDALVAYDRHAVLFGGWANSGRTQYYAYEMSSGASENTGDGTVVRVTPYPYWSSYYPDQFKPYRLSGITENIDYSQAIIPVEGPDRYATAVAASRSAFATGSAEAVIIASGADWPDALGASALAGVMEAPILLSRPNELPPDVAREIVRLGASEAIVVGGAAAVSTAVVEAVDALQDVSVRRVAGDNRYATSAALADEAVRLAAAPAAGTTVFVATGDDFPDALAASPTAAAATRPILLTDGTALSPETASALAALEPSRAILLGGANALSAKVQTAVGGALGSGEVTRVAGRDRYETAVMLAKMGVADCGLGYSGIAIATGESFPDALGGGVMAARQGTVLVLTPSTRLHSHVADLLLANQATVGTPHVLGGESAVRSIVREAIALALQPLD